jgi:hypothetical protein
VTALICAPELNDIETVWRDLNAHQTFIDPEDIEQAIYDTFKALNLERQQYLLVNQRISA